MPRACSTGARWAAAGLLPVPCAILLVNKRYWHWRRGWWRHWHPCVWRCVHCARERRPWPWCWHAPERRVTRRVPHAHGRAYNHRNGHGHGHGDEGSRSATWQRRIVWQRGPRTRALSTGPGPLCRTARCSTTAAPGSHAHASSGPGPAADHPLRPYILVRIIRHCHRWCHYFWRCCHYHIHWHWHWQRRLIHPPLIPVLVKPLLVSPLPLRPSVLMPRLHRRPSGQDLASDGGCTVPS